MYKAITEYMMGAALKHIAVKRAKYQSRVLINQQASNAYLQFIIEDDTYCQLVKQAGVFTMSFNIDVLGKPKDDSEILTVQDDAFQAAVEIIGYISGDGGMGHLMSVYDYDIQMVSHFSNDASAGVRITLQLATPNPLDLCTFMDNFDEDAMQAEPERPLDLIQAEEPQARPGGLVLRPIYMG